MLLACIGEKPELAASVSLDLFYQESCRKIFEAIVTLPDDRKPFAQYEMYRLVGAELAVAFTKAINDLPSVINAPYWLEVCGDYATEREAGRLASEIGTSLSGANDRTNLARIGQRLSELAVSRANTNRKTIGSLLPDVIDNLERAYASGGQIAGLTTGLRKLDILLGGLCPSCLYVVGGRPGVGKSSLLLQMALSVAQSGKPVLYVSLEMPTWQLAERAGQILSGVNVLSMRRGKATQSDFSRLGTAIATLKNVPLMLIDTVRDLPDLGVESAKAVSESGAAALFVDYLQLIHVPNFKENRTAEVTVISNSLKRLAMQLKIPVVAAAQLNRSNVREDRTPTLADLRDSGSIEQDADSVVLLHVKSGDLNAPRVQTDGLMLKNRAGECGYIPFFFDRPTTTFREVDEHAQEPNPTKPEPYRDD